MGVLLLGVRVERGIAEVSLVAVLALVDAPVDIVLAPAAASALFEAFFQITL